MTRISGNANQSRYQSTTEDTKTQKKKKSAKREVNQSKANLPRELDAKKAADLINLTGKDASVTNKGSKRAVHSSIPDSGVANSPAEGRPSSLGITTPAAGTLLDARTRAEAKRNASGVQTSQDQMDALRTQSEEHKGNRTSWAKDGDDDDKAWYEKAWDWAKGMVTSGSAGGASPAMPPGGGEALTILNAPKIVEEVTGDSRDLLNGFKGIFQSGDKNPRLKSSLDQEEDQTPVPDAIKNDGEGSDEEAAAKVAERRRGIEQPVDEDYRDIAGLDPNQAVGKDALTNNPRVGNAINPGSGDWVGPVPSGDGVPDLDGVDDDEDDMTGGVGDKPGGKQPGPSPLGA
jgi:hypothetical protein